MMATKSVQSMIEREQPPFCAVDALTLTEPWASLLVTGQKTVETRSWGVTLDGPRPVLITASKGMTSDDRGFAADEDFCAAFLRAGIDPFSGKLDPIDGAADELSRDVASTPVVRLFRETRGRAIGMGILTKCVEMTVKNEWAIIGDLAPGEYAFGNYGAGRWCWYFTALERFAQPFAVRGHLGLWDYGAASSQIHEYLQKHGFDRFGRRVADPVAP